MNRYEKPFFNGITTASERRGKRKVKRRRKYLREPDPFVAHAWCIDWDVASLYLNQVQPILGLIKSNPILMASSYGIFGTVHVTAGDNIIKKGKSPFKSS